MRGEMWVGTYPADGADAPAGSGEGIWHVATDPITGRSVARQVASAPAPSFLALSPDGSALFAVGETAPGMVLRFEVATDGSLTERERVTSGGSEPCHLLVHPSGQALYVSHYGSGSLAVVPLVADDQGGVRFAGGVGQVLEHSGRGPHDRQAGPHVHSTVLMPAEGGDVLLALDLGTDELRRYRVGQDGLLAVDGLAGRLPHGAGPRHAAVTSAGHLLVVAELTAELYLLAWDPVTATVSPLDRLPVAEPPALPSHLTVSAGTDRDHVLVGVRATERTTGDGPDRLAAVDVVGDRLVSTQPVPMPPWPRHHVVADDLVWVAGQVGHLVTAYRLVDGTPTMEPVEALAIPSPACVLLRPSL